MNVATSSFFKYTVYRWSRSGSLCKGWAYSRSSYDSMRFTMSWKTWSLMFMSFVGFSRGIPLGNRFFTSCSKQTNFIRTDQHRLYTWKHLKIDNFAFESVENFNYLGSILNANNKMNYRNCWKNSKRQQIIICQCKTNKIEIPNEKHQNENI